MKSRLFFAMLIGLFAISAVRANQSDKASKVTFGESIQIPGEVLPAGTYTFKLFNPGPDQHIVLIFNEDGTRLIQTVVAVPNSNLHPSDKTVLIYGEHPAGKPAALEAWFSPGSNFAQVFVYPKSESADLSRLNNAIVPSYRREESKNSGENRQPGALTNSAPAASSSNRQDALRPNASKSLPRTASELPLIAFAGATFILLAVGLGLFRRIRG